MFLSLKICTKQWFLPKQIEAVVVPNIISEMSTPQMKSVWGNPAAGGTSNNKTNKSKDKKPKAAATKNAPNSGNSIGNVPKATNNVDKFKEVQKKHLQAAQKHIEHYESSSEEELENDSLLESVFKSYGGDKAQLQKTQEFLENAFQSGAATCLICIATVKRTDYVSFWIIILFSNQNRKIENGVSVVLQIWTCDSCYSFFHLNCIQRWASDSTSVKKMNQELEVGYYNNQGEYIAPRKHKSINWCCPKCRTDYAPTEIPRQYVCFCKKEINPQNHPWLVPHSCGEICRKELTPNCGHRCVLLCHPGKHSFSFFFVVFCFLQNNLILYHFLKFV